MQYATTAGWERPTTGHNATVTGPKPNMTGSSKNASGPVGIPLFGAPGDKPNPSEEASR